MPPTSPAPTAPDTRAVGFGQALRFWFWLGCVSFGGPAGQIALMHEELVVRRRWISEQRYLHALHYCMLLPGPEAQQLATYIGWLMHRTRGGIAAGALFVLPSLLLLIGLSWAYTVWGQHPWGQALLWGLKPAVTALVLQAVHRMAKRALQRPWLWALAALSLLGMLWGVGFAWLVLGAGLLGTLVARWQPAAPSAHASAAPATAGEAAWIDDDTPTPPHARYRLGRLLRAAGTGLGLWALSLGALALWLGPTHTLTRMGGFFTEAALLTFGGAYAVLPYVYQGAIEQYGWLTPRQMIDGLALGETTPGPLIMVVAFVAFVGAYGQPPFAGDSAFASGALAAALVTWFTFLPSFLFILAGGPLVESTHGRLQFTAPLTGITAAVVGVIVNLALFFAYHVLWPEGFGGTFDWLSAAITLGAGVALLGLRRGVIETLLACALLGLAVQLLA